MKREQQNGPTPAERFLAFTKKVTSVPKAVIDQREAEYQRARKQNRKKGK